MKDLIGKAYAYLDNKGCKSMGQQYTAFEVERMLADFTEQQLNLLTIPDVVGRSEQLKAFNCVNFVDGHGICKTQCEYCKRVKGF